MYNMDATINFDIMWMRANRKSAISVKLHIYVIHAIPFNTYW